LNSTQQPVRIVLLGINSQYVHSALAPWCLKAGLKAYAKTAHQALVVEGTVNEPPARVLQRVAEADPQVLGICCYIWNISYVETLLPQLRAALPYCVIVLGGPEVSHRAADVLTRYAQVEYVISGEGELPFARLVDALAGQGALKDVPGLCYRADDGMHISASYQHETMQPSPCLEEYIAALDGRIAYLETSRGCPYACAFCLSGRGETLRHAPMERAQQEILQLAQSGAQTIKLVDRTFNADRSRARALLAFMAEEYGKGIPENVCFHFEIAGDLLDEATLALVNAAPRGLFQFEIGLQSMHESTLRRVRRYTDMEHLKKQVRTLIAGGRAHVHLDLIAGLPGETLADFARGFDAAYALRPHALQLGFLKLIHGSAMREQPEQYPCTFDPAPPYQVQSTPAMSQEDFAVLTTAERALDKLHNSGRFVRTLRFLTGDAGCAPFELFLMLGQSISGAEKQARKGSLSLDELTDTVHDALAAAYPQHAALLRDLLLQDRLSSTVTTVLPRSLKRRDTRFHPVKRALNERFPRTGDAPRAIGFLYAGNADSVVWCDYENKDPVTGLYPLHEMRVQECLGRG
jgi:radical SAM superfamily enzyme YgiQ (UPF0313 family)